MNVRDRSRMDWDTSRRKPPHNTWGEIVVKVLIAATIGFLALSVLALVIIYLICLTFPTE